MNDNLVINVVNDDSVSKKIKATALKLKKKYSKQRKINEKYLKERTTPQKIGAVLINIVCVVLFLLALLMAFSAAYSKIQKTCSSMFGYSNLTIVSGSMTASGHKKGDVIIVRSVNTDTLKIGDKIAFYSYSKINKSASSLDVNSCTSIENDDVKTEYKSLTIQSIIGMQSSEIVQASKAGTSLIFHHIQAIYEDEDGTRWFVTKGSSNAVDDLSRFGYINENMIVGIYVDTGFTQVLSFVLKSLSSTGGVFMVLIPIIPLILVIIHEHLRDIYRARLELDCVEEKRKITDPICIKYDIGYNMDKKTKYKVLAQAEDEDKVTYIALLWKDGAAPASIKKYAFRKDLMLKANRQLLELNRECEQMFKDGKEPTKIAAHYLKEKDKINKEHTRYQHLLRTIHKKYM